MERARIEEFTRDGKSFMYIDLSDIRSNEEFIELAKHIEPAVEKYPVASLHTITNIDNIRFDTKTKEIVARYLEHNKPYVKHGVIIGFDGVKKMIVNMVFALSGRNNLDFAFTKEQAVELLLQKE